MKISSLDPIAEARARVALRYRRARPMAKGAPSIGQAAAKYARKALPEPRTAIDKLRARWRDIVGESIAKYCEPEKITSGRNGKILTIRVIPQAAPLIQHRSGEIRQRVSVAAGGDIARLKLVQGLLSGQPNLAPVRDRRVLSPEELAALQRDTAGIDDPTLREAIVSLGSAMLSATPKR